jgi:hypothetical protein
MHDEMCAAVVARPEALLYWLNAEEAPIKRVVPEYPCGTGYLDVLIERADVNEAYLVEVKTDAEHASAGDVIRQLRWYSSNLRGYDRKHLVCLVESNYPRDLRRDPFTVLTEAAGVRLVHWPQFTRIQRDIIDGDRTFDGPFEQPTTGGQQ